MSIGVNSGDDQLAKRRKKSVRSSTSTDDMNYSSPTESLMGMAPHLAGGTCAPLGYTAPHKMELYSPTGSSSDGEINSTSYVSDSNSSLSSPQNPPSYLNYSSPPVKQELPDEAYTRPIPPEIATEIQNLEKEYKAVFDSPYPQDQAKKLSEKPHSANDLFNMTDIFIRRLIKFAKHIPEFKILKQEDQIYLLKVGWRFGIYLFFCNDVTHILLKLTFFQASPFSMLRDLVC